MDFWVTKLREQAAQITSGTYVPGSPTFARAPAGIAELSGDLDGLARLIAEREAIRTALAREVHHRVKNNLQIITSLLNMQAGRLDNPIAREALGQTRARIEALALIHRILYDQDDEGSLAMLDIVQLVSELGGQLRFWHRDRGEIIFASHADTLAVSLDSAMPLALFAVEAVTNAYAYAFPDSRSGAINLRFTVEADGNATFVVADDGIGFDSTAHENSMGRQLMKGFARQLGATLSITSSAETGTQVALTYRPAA